MVTGTGFLEVHNSCQSVTPYSARNHSKSCVASWLIAKLQTHTMVVMHNVGKTSCKIINNMEQNSIVY